MRKIILAALMMGTAVMSQAQVQATMHEEVRAMSKGSYNCIVLDLPGTTVKGIEQAWKSFSKDYKGKTDFDKKLGEFFTDEAVIKEMSDNNVDMYVKIVQKGETATEMAIWYNLGVTYLSSAEYPTRYPAAEKMLKSFVKLVSLEMIETELKDNEKKLKDLESQLKDLEKSKAQREADIVKYQATIAEMQANIQKAEADITKNVADQSLKNGEIEAQKQVVLNIQTRLEQVKAGN